MVGKRSYNRKKGPIVRRISDELFTIFAEQLQAQAQTFDPVDLRSYIESEVKTMLRSVIYSIENDLTATKATKGGDTLEDYYLKSIRSRLGDQPFRIYDA